VVDASTQHATRRLEGERAQRAIKGRRQRGEAARGGNAGTQRGRARWLPPRPRTSPSSRPSRCSPARRVARPASAQGAGAAGRGAAATSAATASATTTTGQTAFTARRAERPRGPRRSGAPPCPRQQQPRPNQEQPRLRAHGAAAYAHRRATSGGASSCNAGTTGGDVVRGSRHTSTQAAFGLEGGVRLTSGRRVSSVLVC
jgi:hypothetical protein